MHLKKNPTFSWVYLRYKPVMNYEKKNRSIIGIKVSVQVILPPHIHITQSTAILLIYSSKFHDIPYYTVNSILMNSMILSTFKTLQKS